MGFAGVAVVVAAGRPSQSRAFECDESKTARYSAPFDPRYSPSPSLLSALPRNDRHGNPMWQPMAIRTSPRAIQLPNPTRVPRPSPHDRLLPPLAIARLHLFPHSYSPTPPYSPFPPLPILPLSPYSPFPLSPSSPLSLFPFPPPPPFPPHPPPSYGAIRAVPRNVPLPCKRESLGAAEQGAPPPGGSHGSRAPLGAHARVATCLQQPHRRQQPAT
ncbi:unnamed protein product [Closterium sp. NIES-53]